MISVLNKKYFLGFETINFIKKLLRLNKNNKFSNKNNYSDKKFVLFEFLIFFNQVYCFCKIKKFLQTAFQISISFL